MANHKSAKKRARQNEKRRLRNRADKGAVRSEIKSFNVIVESGDKEKALGLLSSLHKAIDKAATKGVLTKNAASRKKSRMTILVNKLSA